MGMRKKKAKTKKKIKIRPIHILRCCFCNKKEGQCEYVITSPGDFPKATMCEECVEVCVQIINSLLILFR